MKPTIIFFHAFPLNSKMWKEQVDDLLQDYNCLTPDLPGFGESPLPDHPITFEFYADYITKYINDLNIEKSYWCGISMGGYLALRLYQRIPQACSGLILCDTKSSADSNDGKTKRWVAINTLMTDYNKFINDHWSALVGISSQSNKALKDHFGMLVSQSQQNGIATGLVAMATRNDSTSALCDIKVPTLIIVGNEDTVTPLAEAKILHEQIYGSKLEIIEKCGHLSNLEQPELFNKTLNRFLNALKN